MERKNLLMFALFPVTYNCNLFCKNCAYAGQARTAIDVKKSMANLAKLTTRPDWVFVTGGEPLLLDDIFSICDEIKELNYKVGLLSNGTIYKPDIATHVDRFGVSLDGDETYHDAYRGAGVYAKAVELLLEVKARGCETVVSSTYYGDNLQNIINLKPAIKAFDPTFWQITTDINKPNLKLDYSLFN